MSDTLHDPDRRDISALFGVLRRRGWIVVVCVVVAAAAAYVYANGQDPTYEASSNLLLRDPQPGPATAAFGTPTPTTAPDREALVLSGPVKARAIKMLAPKLGGRAAAAAAVEDATAFSAEESKVIKITGTASTGATAALGGQHARRAEHRVSQGDEPVAKIHRAQQVAQRALRALGSPQHGIRSRSDR